MDDSTVIGVVDRGVVRDRGASALGVDRDKVNCSVALVLWLRLGTSQKK